MSRVIALDLGGVIVDVDHARCAARIGSSRAALEAAFFDDGLHDAVTTGALDGPAFVRRAASRLGLPFADVWSAWGDVVRVEPAGRAVVADLLAAGHQVHLWTNTDPIHLERIAAELPAGVLVASASCRLGAMKPHAAYWARAALLGRPALFLDDRHDNVAAAGAAGIMARRCVGPVQARALLVRAGLL